MAVRKTPGSTAAPLAMGAWGAGVVEVPEVAGDVEVRTG